MYCNAKLRKFWKSTGKMLPLVCWSQLWEHHGGIRDLMAIYLIICIVNTFTKGIDELV